MGWTLSNDFFESQKLGLTTCGEFLRDAGMSLARQKDFAAWGALACLR